VTNRAVVSWASLASRANETDFSVAGSNLSSAGNAATTALGQPVSSSKDPKSYWSDPQGYIKKIPK
jgi:hypothetical protein